MLLHQLFRQLRSRRVHPRAPLSLNIDWRVFGRAVRRVSTTVDLSRGGAFVSTSEPTPAGTPLVMELATPHGRIEMHGRVAWTSKRGMGVSFSSAWPDALA
jgi:PilZ domain-containing protein